MKKHSILRVIFSKSMPELCTKTYTKIFQSSIPLKQWEEKIKRPKQMEMYIIFIDWIAQYY